MFWNRVSLRARLIETISYICKAPVESWRVTIENASEYERPQRPGAIRSSPGTHTAREEQDYSKLKNIRDKNQNMSPIRKILMKNLKVN